MEDQGPQAPLNSIFANQFKRITRKKCRVFVLRVAISDPHIAFYERNAITRAGFTIIWRSTSKGPRPKIVRLLFGLPQYLNCRGDAGGRSPHREVASPHRDLASPPSRFRRPPIESRALNDQRKNSPPGLQDPTNFLPKMVAICGEDLFLVFT